MSERYRPVYSGDSAVLQEFLRIGAVLEALAGKLEIRYAEPERPRAGMLAICDGSQWNPLGDGLQAPVWFDGADWQPLGKAVSSGSGVIDAGAPDSVYDAGTPVIDLGGPS